jgi:hypothetical protein
MIDAAMGSIISAAEGLSAHRSGRVDGAAPTRDPSAASRKRSSSRRRTDKSPDLQTVRSEDPARTLALAEVSRMLEGVSGGGFGVRDEAGVVRHVFLLFFRESNDPGWDGSKRSAFFAEADRDESL